MKKCRKISAQAYVHKRIRADGACLRSDRKIPTRTKRTRIVGSLSSNELTGYPWKYRGYGLAQGGTIERQYHEPVQFQYGDSCALVGKVYCFNGIRRSSVTFLPSGRSTGSAGTKVPRTNRARMVREGFACAGRGVVGAGVKVGRAASEERFSRALAGAIPSASRDLRSSNLGTPAESSATFASASASRFSSRRTCSMAKYCNWRLSFVARSCSGFRSALFTL